MNTSQKSSNYPGKILSNTLAEYKIVKGEVKAKAAETKELIAEQKNCGIHSICERKLGEQIATLTEDNEELNFQKAGKEYERSNQSDSNYSKHKYNHFSLLYS